MALGQPCAVGQPRQAQESEGHAATKAEVLELLAAAEGKDLELLTFLFLDAETGARRGELAALRLSDFDDDAVTIARALTVGLMTEENLRAYRGHIWPAGRPRGNLPTALIEKDVPKNEGSMRTISLSPATIDLVRLQRVRLTEAMLGVGLVYPEDGFLFPSTPEGTKPWRPDTWTHRFIRLRDGSACACAYTTFAISSPPPCSRPGWTWPPLPDASATGAAGRRPWPSTRTSYGSPIASPRTSWRGSSSDRTTQPRAHSRPTCSP